MPWPSTFTVAPGKPANDVSATMPLRPRRSTADTTAVLPDLDLLDLRAVADLSRAHVVRARRNGIEAEGPVGPGGDQAPQLRNRHLSVGNRHARCIRHDADQCVRVGGDPD